MSMTVRPVGRHSSLHLVLQVLPGQGVDRAERLVHQHHVGIVGEHAGDLAALLHAARQLVGRALGERRPGRRGRARPRPRPAARRSATPRSRIPSSTFSRTDSHGYSDVGCWNTTPRSRPGPSTGRVRRRVTVPAVGGGSRRRAAAASTCRSRWGRRSSRTRPASMVEVDAGQGEHVAARGPVAVRRPRRCAARAPRAGVRRVDGAIAGRGHGVIRRRLRRTSGLTAPCSPARRRPSRSRPVPG